MNVKEFLERAMHLDVLIDSHVAELDHFRRLSLNIGSSRLEEHVCHSKSNEAPYVKWVERLIDKERELNEEIDRLVAIKLEISSFIDKIDNPRWQYILRSRYIMGCSWEQIGKGMGCSASSIKRSHKKALQQLKKLKLRTPETLMRQGFIGFSDIRRHHIMHTVSGTFPINRAVLP